MLITVAEAKEFIKMGSTDTTKQKLVENIVSKVTAFVETMINYKLDEETIEEIYNGDGDLILYLNHKK